MSTECWFRLLDDTKAQRNMCNNEKCNFPISLETPHGKHPTSIRSIDFKLACLPTGKGVKSIVKCGNMGKWKTVSSDVSDFPSRFALTPSENALTFVVSLCENVISLMTTRRRREGGRGCANIAFAKDKLRRYVDDPLIASFATLALLARLKRGGRQREPRGKRGGGQAPEKCL